MEIKCDTARFDRRQWYIEGFDDFFFTTQEDAKDALRLSGCISSKDQEELADKIRKALP